MHCGTEPIRAAVGSMVSWDFGPTEVLTVAARALCPEHPLLADDHWFYEVVDGDGDKYWLCAYELHPADCHGKDNRL